MKKALVFLADGCEMGEALCVVDVLRRAGINVFTAGVTGERVVSSHNVEIKADVMLSEVKNEEWDLVYAPGGMPAATNLASSSIVNSIILDTYNKGNIVSAICASPAVVFGPLGIIKSGKATCYPGCEDYAPGIDVSKVAESYGGGGHKYAAGFSLNEEKFKSLLKIIINSDK